MTASTMAIVARMIMLSRLSGRDEPVRSTLKLMNAWLDKPALSMALTYAVWFPCVRFSNLIVVFVWTSSHEALSILIS